MYKITYTSGFLWVFYSLLALSFSISITRAPEMIINFQTVMLLLLSLGMVIGVLLIISAKAQQNRKNFKKIERILISELVVNKFSVLDLQIAVKTGIRPYYVEKHIRNMAKKTGDLITVNEKGLISVRKLEIENPKKKK